MRSAAVATIILVIAAASLGIGYLASNSASTSTSAFTYTTTSTSTISPYITRVTTVNGTTVTQVSISVATSTITTTWGPGQPIPAQMVAVDNFSMPDGNTIVFNPGNNRFYILGTSTVTVVDAISHSVLASVRLPANNTGGSVNAGLAIDASTGMVYASFQGGVAELNGSTNTLVGELPYNFGTLAVDPTTDDLWGTTSQGGGGPDSGLSGHLVKVDLTTSSVVASVPIAFEPFDIAVDPATGMVYADGCAGSFVCGSQATVVNGTSDTVVATANLGSADYPTMTLDTTTHVLYVSGGQQLAAINGTTGATIFNLNPETCGPFTNMVVDTKADLVYTSSTDYNYLLAYNGSTGKLANMYTFGNSVGPIAFNPNTSDLFVYTSRNLIAVRPLTSTGNLDAALLGSTNQCPLP